MSEPLTFKSPSEEIAYWKKLANESQAEAKTAKEELDEFQEGSRELEAELEAQLEQAEARLKEYRSLSNRLQMDNDQLRDKLEQGQREFGAQVQELRKELLEMTSIRDQLGHYVRELEQQNDDLERAKRSTIASLEDFESRLNVAIERNAFLESELDEKESLKVAMQRMKDETRDLKAELRVVKPNSRFSLDSSSSFDNDRQKSVESDSNKLAEASMPMTPPKSAGASPKLSGNLTPSARLSALNIVGDLLRKVGALELKLVSCRNIVKENGAPSGGGNAAANNNNASTGSSPTSVAKSRLPRGSSTPSIKKMVDNLQ